MINGHLMDASQVAECLMLVVLIAFSVQYLLLRNWWRKPIGWSVMIERASFILLLILLILKNYLPHTLTTITDYLLASTILLVCASAGICIGLVIMWRFWRRKQHRPLTGQPEHHRHHDAPAGDPPGILTGRLDSLVLILE